MNAANLTTSRSVKLSRAGLSDGYWGEIAPLTNCEWSDITTDFTDKSVYQTWAYGAANFGPKALHHVILRGPDGQVAAAAQVASCRWSHVMSVAHIKWGPLWRKCGENRPNYTALRAILQFIRQEFSEKRRMYVRILPRGAENADISLATMYKQEGFHGLGFVAPYQTLMLDLSPTLEELRKNLRKSWRYRLRRSEALGLTVDTSTDVGLFREAMCLHGVMVSRKKYPDFSNIKAFERAQLQLCEGEKLTVSVCRFENRPVAAKIYSCLGDTGVSIMAATDQVALELGAAYLLWWKMVEDLKKRKCRWCDLGGINPKVTPGTFVFKSGLAGNRGANVRYLGVQCSAEYWPVMAVAKSGEFLRETWRSSLRSL